MCIVHSRIYSKGVDIPPREKRPSPVVHRPVSRFDGGKQARLVILAFEAAVAERDEGNGCVGGKN
jgi:hypothetical protein